jgi:hypothetical protein
MMTRLLSSRQGMVDYRGATLLASLMLSLSTAPDKRLINLGKENLFAGLYISGVLVDGRRAWSLWEGLQSFCNRSFSFLNPLMN